MNDKNRPNFELNETEISAFAAAKARRRPMHVTRDSKAKNDRQFRAWNCAFTDCRKPTE